jgi:hypothetical protein
MARLKNAKHPFGAFGPAEFPKAETQLGKFVLAKPDFRASPLI